MFISIFKHLQKEIIVFLISAISAYLIFLLFQSIWQSSLDDKQNASNELLNARHRYYTALDNKRTLEEFGSRFTRLQQRGVIGDEQRLNWIDVIEKLTDSDQIPYLKYVIEKRQPVTNPQLLQKFPSLDIFQSKMTLEMELLHEGDLFTVLNTLHHTARGLFDIHSCSIFKKFTQASTLLESSTDRNFTASCILNWYTMQHKTAVIPQVNRS